MSTEVAEFKEFDANLAEFEAQYADRVYNLDDPGDNKQARSDQRAIGVVIANLGRAHKAIKEPMMKDIKVLDAEKKRLETRLRGVQGGIKDQIAEYDAAQERHEEELLARVSLIREKGELLPGCGAEAVSPCCELRPIVRLCPYISAGTCDARQAPSVRPCRT